jgi:hypothetical protein
VSVGRCATPAAAAKNMTTFRGTVASIDALRKLNRLLKASPSKRNIGSRLKEACKMTTPHPSIGDWYRLNGGESFEIVAVDEDDGTIDIQYFDGTLEEMDLEDWEAHWSDGVLEVAEAPEDWSGSVDIERGDVEGRGSEPFGEDRDLRASSLDGIDLFE